METTVESGDTRIALSRRAGDAPGTVVAAHANGFCKETWVPVLDLVPGVSTLSLDQRGHGSSSVGDPPFDWWDCATDVLAVIDAVTPTPPLVGLGHSLGGAALAMAEILAPGTFRGLVLVEPIIYPGPYRRSHDQPLAVQALRRRRSFTSMEDVLQTFRGRGPFARWVPEALEAYAEHGTVDRDDGTRQLACAPEVEAEFYRGATAHGAWERLGEIACPVVVVVGAESDSHPAEFAGALTERFRLATLDIVPDATHFVPMERPDAVAGHIREVLGV